MGRLGRAVGLRNRQGTVAEAGIGARPLVLLSRPTSAAGRPRFPVFGAYRRPQRRNPRGNPAVPLISPLIPSLPWRTHRMSYPSQKRRLRPARGVAAGLAALMAAAAGFSALPSAHAAVLPTTGPTGMVQTMAGNMQN